MGWTRVQAGIDGYRTGIHRADRVGYEHAFRGEPHNSGYRHPAYSGAYHRGFKRGTEMREKIFGASPSGVRQGSLKPPCAGSNPAAPTNNKRVR